MWTLRTNPRASIRAANTLNLQGISSSTLPFICLLTRCLSDSCRNLCLGGISVTVSFWGRSWCSQIEHMATVLSTRRTADTVQSLRGSWHVFASENLFPPPGSVYPHLSRNIQNTSASGHFPHKEDYHITCLFAPVSGIPLYFTYLKTLHSQA